MRSTRRKEMENPRFQLREAELLLFTTSLKEYVSLCLSPLFFLFLKKILKRFILLLLVASLILSSFIISMKMNIQI